ncbi:nucleotide sugar dehydrogenase [Acidimicrobiia bacterium]|nr:nucleotide sugar dehydrogenase [Acidimicrobiia bacterium]MDC0596103.1 nucleotide sugar dehydrogenase [Acidimicrobiia bacterium]
MSNFKYDVAVIGLGYVGLPLAIQATSSDLKVYGYDIDENKISNYNLGKSTIEDISDKVLEASLEKGLFLSSDPKYLSESKTIVISVPTPLTDYQPDLSYVKAAAETIAKNITKNQIIILESTTYPGTTVEVLIPVIEEISNLKAGVDFFVGYSPERIDPGNDTWNFKNTPKVISGINDESLLKIENFYKQIIDTVVRVSGTKEAEMVKLLENTYRHVNIALINELAILCNMLEIDIWEVVNAAKTKPFGFESFRPGPGVGGHCIPVDPNYLSFKTRQIGKPVRFVELAQEINNSMPSYVVSRLLEKMNLLEKPFKNSNILILGVAYKKDIGDTRESPAIGIIENLFERGVNVKYFDPFVDNILVNEKYVEKENSLDNIDKFDLVLVHTAHTDFENFDFTKVSVPIFDATGSDHFKNAERI